MNSIQELQEKSHSTAVEKGFWETEKSLLENPHLTTKEKFVIKQLFQSQRLMLVVSELSEALEHIRKEPFIPLTDYDKKYIDESEGEEYITNFKKYVKDGYADELADSTIRLMDISGGEGIDLQWHILAKQRFNATREKMHGKTF